MKTCSQCRLEKPLADFYVSRKTKDGHQYQCKDCQKANAKGKYKPTGGKPKPPLPPVKVGKAKPPVFAKPYEPPTYRFHPIEPDKRCIECGRDLPGEEFSYKSFACHSCTHQVWIDTARARLARLRVKSG